MPQGLCSINLALALPNTLLFPACFRFVGGLFVGEEGARRAWVLQPGRCRRPAGSCRGAGNRRPVFDISFSSLLLLTLSRFDSTSALDVSSLLAGFP
jgi:hypothetical protein